MGFTYDYSRAPQSADAAADNDALSQLTKKSEYGPTLGFFAGGFRFLFCYFVGGSESYNETRTQADGTQTENFSLTNHLRNGYEFIIGYSFNLTSNIQIGPSLAYRHVAYKTQDASNALQPADPNQNYTDRAFTTDAVESNLTPMISLMIHLF